MRRTFLCIALAIMFVLATGMVSYAQHQTFIEGQITDFVRKIYSDDDNLQVKFGNIAAPLRGQPRVKAISFAKVPDGKGDGVCLVEIIDGRTNRVRGVYVPFKTIRKTKVYVLNNSGKKGDVVKPESVTARETQFNEKKPGYPSKVDDILGRRLKRDLAAGTVITYAMIEDPFVIQKGEVVNIVAENRKLLVRTKGKAMEAGKIGDSIRVKNAVSDKEILGKVVDDTTIVVKF